MFSLVWNRNKKMKKKQKQKEEKQRNEMKDAKEMKTSSHPSSSCHWGGHWAGEGGAVRDPKVANKKSQECREKRGGREEKQRGEDRQRQQ